jgi:Domain of unknown function (DUF6752)
MSDKSFRDRAADIARLSRAEVSAWVAKHRDAPHANSLEVKVARLTKRVSDLEAEVQENRQLNVRLAELTDVVQELLVPVAQRDEKRLEELLTQYAKAL